MVHHPRTTRPYADVRQHEQAYSGSLTRTARRQFDPLHLDVPATERFERAVYGTVDYDPEFFQRFQQKRPATAQSGQPWDRRTSAMNGRQESIQRRSQAFADTRRQLTREQQEHYRWLRKQRPDCDPIAELMGQMYSVACVKQDRHGLGARPQTARTGKPVIHAEDQIARYDGPSCSRGLLQKRSFEQ